MHIIFNGTDLFDDTNRVHEFPVIAEQSWVKLNFRHNRKGTWYLFKQDL